MDEESRLICADSPGELLIFCDGVLLSIAGFGLAATAIGYLY